MTDSGAPMPNTKSKFSKRKDNLSELEYDLSERAGLFIINGLKQTIGKYNGITDHQ